MTTTRKQYSGNFPSDGTVALQSGIGAADLSCQVTSTIGVPDGTIGKFTITINAGGGTEERILCTGRVGSLITFDPSGRGHASTTATAHNAGEKVTHDWTAADADATSAHMSDAEIDPHSTRLLNDLRHDLPLRHSIGPTSVIVSAGPTSLVAGGPNVTGSNSSVAISNHVHGAETGPPARILLQTDVAVIGTSGKFADSLHGHQGGRPWKSFARTNRASTNITLNQSAWTDVDNALDLVLTAAAGDLVTVKLSGWCDANAVVTNFDAVSVVAGAPVNSWAVDGAPLASGQGLMAWRANQNSENDLGGSVDRLLVAGDIEGGNVRIRLRYRNSFGTTRELFSAPGIGVTFSAINWGS